MKPTALLVNTARGPIVDPAALERALHERAIAGAALDVTDPEPLPADHPLLEAPNLLVVPHVGSATVRTPPQDDRDRRRQPARRAGRRADAAPGQLTRVAIVDIGTNSTRLLIADVGDDGPPEEVERRSVVTRLGEGVDAGGRLGDAAAASGCSRCSGSTPRRSRSTAPSAPSPCMTSAVRDAANGAAFARAVGERFGLDARTLSGDEEARLTYLGATAARADPEPLLVIDIGGGSTELVIGVRGEVRFHVSTQIGVVRHSERHLSERSAGRPRSSAHSPVRWNMELEEAVPAREREQVTAAVAVAGTATQSAGIDLGAEGLDVEGHRLTGRDPAELGALAGAVERELEEAVPATEREHVTAAVAVAGTATQSAGIDLGAEGLDVEGHVLSKPRLDAILERLAALPLAERREVPGLDPDRAPTIVAGVVVLTRALAAFGLDEVEVSERDILWGAALETGRSTTSN